MYTNVKEETRRSSSFDILSSFRPSTSTNCGNTDNGEAFATTVGKHNLSSGSILLIRTGYHSDKRLQNVWPHLKPQFLMEPQNIPKREVRRNRSMIFFQYSLHPRVLKLNTLAVFPIPLPASAEDWPLLPPTLESKAASSELMSGMVESNREPSLSCKLGENDFWVAQLGINRGG